MLVKRNDFLNTLKRVMPGIATGACTIEGANNFVFHNGNVYSYNSTVSVMTPVGQDLNLEGTVSAVDLFTCLQKFPDDFELETSSNVWILKCGKIKVKVNLLNDIEAIFDRFERLVPSDDWIEIPENELHNAFVQCAMSNNKAKFAGIFIDGNKVYSSDGLQVNRYVLKKEYESAWISDGAVAEILKWNDFDRVQFNNTWLQFTNGEVVFSVKTLFLEDVKAITEKKFEVGLDVVEHGEIMTSGVFNDEVYEAISRATSFSESVMNQDSVIITLDNDDVIISAKRNSGEFSEIVNIGSHVDEAISFAIPLTAMDNLSKFYKNFDVVKNATPNKPPRLLFKNELSVHLIATLKM